MRKEDQHKPQYLKYVSNKFENKRLIVITESRF